MGGLADLCPIAERHSSWRNGWAKREEQDVNYFANFDRYAIGERNDGLGREVLTLRLQRRLREGREARSGLRLASFVSKSTQPLLRRAGLAD